MGRVARQLALLALPLVGCTREAYRNADLQLDILAGLPEGAEQVRICAEGLRSRTVGAGGERYALPGLPLGEPAAVTVDLLVALEDADTGGDGLVTIARSVPVEFSEQQPYLVTELEQYADSAEQAQACASCPTPCETATSAAENQEESWLLAVRFEG